jgi:beta-lactam-binding protein with PASTA domain
MRRFTWKHVLINLLVILAILTGLLIYFFEGYLPNTTNQGVTVTVPKLEGRSYSDLENYLDQYHLRYEVNDSTFDSDFPPLTVMKQFPRAGALVKENRKIFISLNAKNPPKVKMPRLLDSSVKNAALVLKSFGLELGEITYKPDIAANAVLEQRYKGKVIAEGTEIAKGSKIDLVVGDGRGDADFEVPNVMGMDLESAQFAIVGGGFKMGEISYDVSTDKTPNTVLRQVPPAGVKATIGEKIDVWVAEFDPNKTGLKVGDETSLFEEDEPSERP